MPEPIVEVSVHPSTDKLRLEWGMTVDDGKWLWASPQLEVHLYCEPFPGTYGNPELIHTGLEGVQIAHLVESGIHIPIIPMDWAFGREKSRGSFYAQPVSSDVEGRYFSLHLQLDEITPGDAAVCYFPIEWSVDATWMHQPFTWWVEFGYHIRGKFKCIKRVEKPMPVLVPAAVVDPAHTPYVFISYQRESEQEANQIRQYLENTGFRVWQDVEDIRHTTRWPVVINRALQDTTRLLLLLTPKSMQSDEVLNEWFFYYSKRKPIHCLLLETCEIFYQLKPFQYLDWRKPTRRDWQRLTNELLAPFEWPSVALKEKVINSDFAPKRTLPEALRALHTALISESELVVLSDAQLQEIRFHQPVDETEYRLMRYAEWCSPKYQLDERFVQLTMLLHDREKGWIPQHQFSDLREILEQEQTHTLVLLGDPGAGKSTLLRRLEMDTTQDVLRSPDRQTLTFFISLSEYGLGVSESNLLPSPIEWLSEKWQNKYPALPSLEAVLHERRLLLLLDSLNEMPHTDRSDFERKATLWQAFIYDWVRDQPGNRAIFACRTLDYGAVLSTDENPIPQIQLQPMTREQVRDYLENYAPDQAAMIWDSFQDDPRQFELFRIPFLLQLLIDRVKDDGRLPGGRAESFNGFVYRLARREIGRRNPLFEARGVLLTEDDIALLRDLVSPPGPYDLPEEGLLLPALTTLAFGMQKRKPGEENGLVTLPQKEALNLLPKSIYRHDVLTAGCAMNVLDRVDHSLICYYHQLIQEFFAARKLARRPQPELVRVQWRTGEISPTLEEVMRRIADSDPLPLLPQTGWEETTLLSAAMSTDPDSYVRGLIDTNLPLAARCAAAPDVAASDRLCDQIRQALIARIQHPDADLRARIAAGLALGEIGDPRFQHLTGPHGEFLLPPMILIEGGEYIIGSDDGLYKNEGPVHTVQIETFGIGKFPVTNAEYALFILAGGYEEEQWWDSDESRAWRRGEATSEGLTQQWRENRQELLNDPGLADRLYQENRITSEQLEVFNEMLQMNDVDFENWLTQKYPGGQKKQPLYWDDHTYNNPAQPVVGVCWYEARAYCLWLSAQTRRTFRLPTEAEWEAAARGKEGYCYPYGNEFNPTFGNTFEGHIRRTTPVGVFPNGQTPRGLVDMSGNVWDWTSTAYRTYPYRLDDGRENPTSHSSRRVLRGGSWRSSKEGARVSYRQTDFPGFRNFNRGFRVVIAPPPYEDSPES